MKNSTTIDTHVIDSLVDPNTFVRLIALEVSGAHRALITTANGSIQIKQTFRDRTLAQAMRAAFLLAGFESYPDTLVDEGVAFFREAFKTHRRTQRSTRSEPVEEWYPGQL